MTTFYLSTSCLSYKQYLKLNEKIKRFGWTTPWEWPQQCFHTDAYISKQMVAKAVNSIARTDIFIAVLPGTPSAILEIGTAYTLCEEVFLVSKDPVYFTQTGLSDAYLSVLPGVTRICCDVNAIPQMLKQKYLHLIEAV